MKTLKQKGIDCLITSLAMVLDEDPMVLKNEIPFDSSEDWFETPTLLLNKRGYHIQELMDCCIRRGYALAVIEMYPRMAPAGYDNQWKLMHPDEDVLLRRFMDSILGKRGIMNGETPSGYPHTVAWDGYKIHDPSDGKIKDISTFRLRDCWILTSLLESNQIENNLKK